MAYPLIPTVKRRGRLTSGQRSTLRNSAIYQPTDCADLDVLFGRRAPRIIDIGFGDGVATALQAAADPHRDVLAIELYPAGVAQLAARLAAEQLSNVRIIAADAREVLAVLDPGSLGLARVFFPDPWPKTRHHKRRLLGSVVLRELSCALRLEGQLHFATDWQPYAEQVLALIEAEPMLTLSSPAGRCERPLTRFEQRAIAAGRTVQDIWAKRC